MTTPQPNPQQPVLQPLPQMFRSGILHLARYAPGQLVALLTALRETPPLLTLTDFAASVAARAALPSQEVLDVISTTISLVSWRDSTGRTSAQVAKEIPSQLASALAEELPSDDPAWTVLPDRLQALLDAGGSLALLLKAGPLQIEHAHFFDDVRVVTDVRPVFGDDLDERPSAALIIHELHLTFTRDGKQEAFFIALGASGLAKIRQAIGRAEAKERTLRKTLSEAGMPVIGETLEWPLS